MNLDKPAIDNELRLLVRPSRDSDVEAMLTIYRRHIRRGIEDSVDDSGTPEPDDLRDRRKNLRNHRLPHLVATLSGEVVGYAYVVQFRKRPAYRFAVKHSIYIHHDHQGRGVGRILLGELIDACAASGFRQMIGYIDADNAASLALHGKFSFERVGVLPGVAYRYGKWCDTVMVQRSLAAGATLPPAPVSVFGR
jgi:phosphinothricin acetyltransferase